MLIFNIGMYIFLMSPIIAVLGASVSGSVVADFPPKGLSLNWYMKAFAHRQFMESFVTSLILATITSVGATALGTLGALGLVRYRFPGRDAAMTFLMSPLILPQVLIGVSLLQFYSKIGWRASIVTLVIGHIIITLPYVVRLVSAGLAGFDRSLELAARNLGAGPLTTFRRITLPLIMAGIVGGAAFAFIVSFDNVTMTIFLTSPRVLTIPVRIFAYMETNLDSLVMAVGSLMVIFAAVMMLIIERAVGVGKVFGLGPGTREGR
ncbi:MAG: ABC transporter permease [Chloroflexi bacterium]|nr:ABC transporter permease [Chloroflexota bacterium]